MTIMGVPKGGSRGIFNSAKSAITRSSASAVGSSSRGGECYYSQHSSLDKVAEALKHRGLGHLNLIIGIHFTETNRGRGDQYERVISIMEETLRSFVENNLYPCFGFGDGKVSLAVGQIAEEVFSFSYDRSPCKRIKEVLTCYRNIVKNVTLSGPTSYAPVIDAAVDIVDKSNGQFHTLVLVADKQVIESFFNSKKEKLSPEGEKTITSIENASSYPLSIILVGVGYGSWEHMKKFQDKIPKREFDNFQFVNFTDIENSMPSDATPTMKAAEFAFAALKDTPLQYKAADKLKLIGPPVPSTHHAPVPSTPHAPVPSTHHAPATSEQSDLSEFVSDKRCRQQNLHAIGVPQNPYKKVISLIGKTFAPFKKDNEVHCFGFGDVTTGDHYVFSFNTDHSPCYNLEGILACYDRIVGNVKPAGQASYAPIIDAAVDIVEKSGGQYHVLIIIAAGQVTRSSYTGDMGLSPQEEYTIRSIADASSYPLFIVVVGVGDGPWEDMKKFKDKILVHNNFQFVNFTDIMSRDATTSVREAAFALTACMTLPMHYMKAFERGLIGRTTGKGKKTVPRPPPVPYTHRPPPAHEPSALSAPVEMVCCICRTNAKDLAFGCGHMACGDCGEGLDICHICRQPIRSRLRVYP